MTQTLTIAICRAAAQDAGNRSMRRAGRPAWNSLDWNAAVAEMDRLMLALPAPVSLQPDAAPICTVRRGCLAGRDAAAAWAEG